MMSTRPAFIVFEGLDGSGKTTCAGQLAEHIGAAFMTTPSPGVRKFRDDLIEQLASNQEAKQLFYLSTVFAASSEVSALLARGQSVVLDRYFLSTQAYAAFRGSQLAIDAVQRLLRPADITFYIDTPLETRRARLSRRGMSAADLETVTAEADGRLREEHLRRADLDVVGRFVRVAGDAGTPRQIVESLLVELRAAESARG